MAVLNKIYITRQKRHLGHGNAYLTLRRAVDAALKCEEVLEPCEVNIMLTDDVGIRAINLENRGIDSATDVLSFPFNELVPGEFNASACEKDLETGRIFLGDMVLSLQRCESQGNEYGHGFEHEIAYLAVHSALHLLGYDHTDEGEQKRLMRSREKVIMADLDAARAD